MIARAWKLAQSGAAVSAVSIYLGVACTLGLAFFAAYWFGDARFGYIVIGNSAVIICAMLGQFGFSHGLVKLIGAYRATDDKAALRGAIRGVMSFCTALSLGIAVVGWLLLRLPIEMEVELRAALDWAVWCIPVWTLMLLSQNVARGFQWMALANLPSTVVHPLLLVGVCYGLTARHEISAAFYFQAYAGLGLLVVGGLWLCLWMRPQVRELRKVTARLEMKSWLAMAYPIGLSVVQMQLLQRADTVVLAMLSVPAEQVGYYGLATRVTQGVGQCTIAFNRYWAASMSGCWELRDVQGLRRVAQRSARLSLFAAVCLALILVFAGKVILSIPGPNFVAAYPMLLVLLVGQLFSAYFAANVILLQMADQQWAATRNFMLTLVPLIAGYFVVVPWAGAMGAAVVTSAGLVLMSLLMMWSCVRKLNCYPGAF